jgi:hypothetical protein
MKINMSKTKEIILKRPKPHRYLSLPAALAGIEQVAEVKLLGVYFNNNFSFNTHANFVLHLCSQRIYLLRQLRNQGLPPKFLFIICQALVISRLLYAVSAWGGFLSAHHLCRINAFL